MMPKKRRRQPFHSGHRHADTERLPPPEMGVGSTLALLRGENTQDTSQVSDTAADDEWETVSRHKPKKRKLLPVTKDNYPCLSYSPQARIHKKVRINDLQALALYLLADGPAPHWISVQHRTQVRKAVVLMVPGLDEAMFESLNNQETFEKDVVPTSVKAAAELPKIKYTLPSDISPDDYFPIKLDAARIPSALEPLASIFTHLWPIKAPGDDKYARLHSSLAAMLSVNITSQEKTASNGPQPAAGQKSWVNQPTRVTEFICQLYDLRDNDYPLHTSLLNSEQEQEDELTRRDKLQQTAEHGWIEIAASASGMIQYDQKSPILDDLAGGRRIFALDCEMCKTGIDQFELTRVSMIDWDGNLVLDELVKPSNPIIDYVTEYSGITKEMMEAVTTTLNDVQERLLKLITLQTILVGHSLESDLNALKLIHANIVDTSILYPHPRGAPLKASLKWLTQKYLGRAIQKGHGAAGHDSLEDARAALDLVKQKCSRGPKWGTSAANSESIFKRLERFARRSASQASSTNGNASDDRLRSAFIDWGNVRKGYGPTATYALSCENDDEAEAAILRAVNGDPDGSYIPGGGVDFVWARLRRLEVDRGWWHPEQSTNDSNGDGSSISQSDSVILTASVATLVHRIEAIYAALPPCTAFIVYSGAGDQRELNRLQALQRQFKREYATKKWDELSVKWTDDEEQAMRAAFREARKGVGFMTVK